MVKVKYLNLNEMLQQYPTMAYYDPLTDEICMPDKDLLFNLIYAHEYIHHLRRDKFTVKLLSVTKQWMILFTATLLMSTIYSFFIYIASLMIALYMASYFYEEFYVQRNNLEKVIGNGETEQHKETA